MSIWAVNNTVLEIEFPSSQTLPNGSTLLLSNSIINNFFFIKMIQISTSINILPLGGLGSLWPETDPQMMASYNNV